MPSSTFAKFNAFIADIGLKKHNLNSDSIGVMLTNTAPVAASNAIKSDITQISYANLGALTDGQTCGSNSYSQSSGTGKFIAADVVFTATGTSPSFRYAVVFNRTATNGELIGWFDYGSSITLGTGDTFTVDFDGSAGLWQLA